MNARLGYNTVTTPTHFTLLSYERALRLPTSFPISGLARLRVKPRLQIVLESFCIHSPAYASLYTSPKEALLACPPFPPWNLPSFTVESTLSSSCSRSDPPFFRQDAALAHLDSLPLIIWYSGQTALFLFPLAKVVPAFLPTVLSAALRPLFVFQQAQSAQVFLLKPAPFCTLFAGLGSTNKPATSLLLSGSRFVLATLSSLPSFSYFKLCGRSGRNCLFLLLFYQTTMGPWTLVSPRERRR